ncbi:hypothetical protein VaNZ11_001043 [Volvox africanus]|uniref:Glucosamine 6-phosphate N-acetyltransferase n=1 Tax=Volvox africanus TaxID=51714 RepID=A0ABQ5RNT6_9CHLO|nr:hypothetical protein VaNZ11_001043 [Volvox africanus]
MATDVNLEVRPLKTSDYEKGFLDLLAHLTAVGEVSREAFEEQLKLRDLAGSYRTVVIEDGGRIIATAAMVIELKFIHSCSKPAKPRVGTEGSDRSRHVVRTPCCCVLSWYDLRMADTDTDTGQFGAGTQLVSIAPTVSQPYHEGSAQVGHIEDVVVDPAYRGKKLGLKLIQALIDLAREAGCYKVILDCSEANSTFYEKCGLTRKEVQMVKYLDR